VGLFELVYSTPRGPVVTHFPMHSLKSLAVGGWCPWPANQHLGPPRGDDMDSQWQRDLDAIVSKATRSVFGDVDTASAHPTPWLYGAPGSRYVTPPSTPHRASAAPAGLLLRDPRGAGPSMDPPMRITRDEADDHIMQRVRAQCCGRVTRVCSRDLPP
jgi:hypothetical protein